ncbi:cactin [Lingula anatina]|uniref:Splicing factor Cactin n=1 Tax=Lingula anatina TaxID=7574 RepID=A0A1S3IY17_LINAN|nr:cactin [Lingula anatina]|eukprot:XP_013403092.1 cactin [Lingula anatina]
MGNRDKKKQRRRSRSRDSIERKRRKRSDSSEVSDGSSDMSSDDEKYRKHKRHRERSRSHEKSSKKKRRSRSRSRERSRSSKNNREQREPDEPNWNNMTKEEKQKQKELLKALETPEEKRARRLAKKEVKARKMKQQMGWDEEYLGYTNEDNPFGDERLLNTFVWQKKLEKTGKKDEEFHTYQRQQMEDTKRELEKVKKRRLEREKEREEREKEREMMQRDKESDYYKAWERQEDTFHLQQAKLRSKIRIEDGRAKPIDLLAKYISAEDDDLTVEMHEPYTYLNGLTIEDLEDLLEDIKVYSELEEDKNADFWRDITIVTHDELSKLRKIDPSSQYYVGDRREGINQAVSSDVSSVFKGKTHNQLLLLKEQIKKKLKGGEGVDVGYWESLLEQLKAHMARTRLRERHQDVLKSKLFRLKQEQGIESDPIFPIIKQEPGTDAGSSERATERDSAGPSCSTEIKDTATNNISEFKEPAPLVGTEQNPEGKEENEEYGEDEEESEALITEEDLLEQSCEEYQLGQYSPRLLKHSDLEADTIVYDPEDDMKRLEHLRLQVRRTGKAQTDTERESEFEKRAREGMNDDEATFSVEVQLEQTMAWSDKYRPRKPRFFNRVHTGFEWNKYNQTHYDMDNPPPKIVQGYKFNIFYPDLIDKTKTPQFSLTPCADNKDFATLKFSAGPPYEDIAFKIVSREWECSYKKGFRCQFHNNIFQLWFHFKRYRYRR